MTTFLTDVLLPHLCNDDRIESATADADEVIVRVDDELLRIACDHEHGRTACWGNVYRLSPGDNAGGAVAALRFNGSPAAQTGLVMGLNRARNTLILGRSVDVVEIGPESVIEMALALRRALPDARALVETVLDELHRNRARPFDGASGNTPLIRV